MELQLKDISKKYGSLTALREFNFAFREGVYGLLGPNGAGKSTLMNIITNNMLPSTGEVSADGVNIVRLGVKYLKKIGYVPQQQNLYPTFSGNRFLYYMAALKGIRKEDAGREIPGILEQLNLSEYANKKIGDYSGGMKQRLLIAQSLLGSPRILIMDEPTVGLDPEERIHIRNIISRISTNKIVIYATHVVSDVETIAEKILLLKKGRLVTAGLTDALLERMKPYVFEVEAGADQLEGLEQEYRIGNIAKAEGGRFCVRLVGEHPPQNMDYIVPRPSLEDAYLYEFGK
jgi:ABC-type multidrug transport system ATPase subunit